MFLNPQTQVFLLTTYTPTGVLGISYSYEESLSGFDSQSKSLFLTITGSSTTQVDSLSSLKGTRKVNFFAVYNKNTIDLPFKLEVLETDTGNLLTLFSKDLIASGALQYTPSTGWTTYPVSSNTNSTNTGGSSDGLDGGSP